MKILGIRFQNLNSLKGTHEIRFDKSPFLESGLFAITGPTGAGKTTILDAITVALYGRVHRHDRDAYEIMTRHTSECYAEAEFAVKGKSYRAKWALRRSRGKVDGKLQDVRMELSEADTGKLIEAKLTESKARIVELTGLDYNQFLRSVMLSQGDFTRFLKASESERSELLEKITDTGIYSQISVWAFEKAKAEKKELENLRGRLHEVELLSAEDAAAYQSRLAELHAEDKARRETKHELEQGRNWLHTIQKLNARKQEATRQLQEQQALLQQQAPAFARLAQHTKAIVFKPALAEINTNKNYIQNIALTLEQLAAQLPEQQNQAQQAEAQLQIAQTEAETATRQLQEAQPVLEQVIALDSQIQSTRNHFGEVEKAYTQLAGEVTAQNQEVQQKKDALQQLNTNYIALQQWLQEHENEACLDKELPIFERYVTDLQDIGRRQQKLHTEQTGLEKEDSAIQQTLTSINQKKADVANYLQQADTEKQELENALQNKLAGQTLPELEAAAAHLPTLIGLCEQQAQLANQFLTQNQRAQALQTQLTQYAQELKTGQEQLAQYQTQKEQAEAHLKDLQNLVELQMRIQKYEADRDLLTPGAPCPLCGSEHHPFAVHRPQNQVSEAEEKRNACQQYLVSFTEQVSRQANTVTALQTKIDSETAQSGQLQTEIAAIEQRFMENNARLPKPLALEKPAVIQAVLERKQQEMEAARKVITEIRTLETQLQQFTTNLTRQREELVKLESQAGQAVAKSENLNQLRHRIQEELTDLQEQYVNISEEAHSFLMPFRLPFDFKNSAGIIADLTKRAELYNQNTRQFRNLQLSRTQTESELQSATETLAAKEENLAHLEVQVRQQQKGISNLESERHQLFGNKTPTAERNRLQEEVRAKTALADTLRSTLQQHEESLRLTQKQQAERTREQTKLHAQTENLTQQLLEQLQPQGISSVEALVALFLSEDEAQQITNRQQQLQNNIASYSRLLQTTEAELLHESGRQLTTESENDLAQKIAGLDAAIGLLNREIGRLEQLLQQDEQLKVQHRALAQQIEVQQKEAARWDKLATLIGSADGKKFGKFAQGLTLARLVMLANQHLQKINQRYRILKNPEQDLDLQIIDTYQADAVRPMTTLSGGESFLVSLALALGLSDLAGRQTQINSLFIDEGFGTLDAETLDMAITSLENLQASGKMIGIISHVEALKERISTQIQVQKMSGGSSKLKIVGHATDAYV